MVLAEPRAAIAGLFQEFSEGGAALGDDPAITGIPRRHLLDDAGRHAVMVAPRQHRRAGRRAERSRMELVVEQAALVELLGDGHPNEAAADARPAEADVIKK